MTEAQVRRDTPQTTPGNGDASPPTWGTSDGRSLAVATPRIVEQPTVGQLFGLIVSRLGQKLRLRPELDRATVLRAIGQGIVVVGVLLLALAAFQGVFGGLMERRDQRELRGRFTEILASGAAYAAVAPDGPIPRGTPVASIAIPKLGIDRIVVEGTTADELRKGPGHLRSTPLPGQHGNAVVAGRRTTYGGAFRDLAALAPGDAVEATTPFGTFTYRVKEVQSLRPKDPDRLGASMRDLLTLTTSDPPFRADRRLVVVSELEGKRSTFPDPLRPAQVGVVEAAFFGNAGAAIPAVAWQIALFVALIAARSLYSRWRRWPTYLLTTPVLLALLLGWLEAMVSLLPSTL